MPTIQSTYPPQLDNCHNEVILDYFENAWQIEDTLMKTLVQMMLGGSWITKGFCPCMRCLNAVLRQGKNRASVV
jgi:hypothetical protein